MRRPWFRLAAVWITITVAGFFGRATLIAVSTGTDAIATDRNFAGMLSQLSLRQIYEKAPGYPATPLMGELSRLWLALSGPDLHTFSIFLKIPQLIADGMVTCLLWTIWRDRIGPTGAWRVAAIFAWSLTSIVIGSYHGGAQCLSTALCLLSAVLAEKKAHHGLAGGVLGAAINVTLVPVWCIPVLLAPYRSWRDARHFIGGLSLGAIPFLATGLGSWGPFFHGATSDQAPLEHWGIPYFLESGQDTAQLGPILRYALELYTGHGTLIVLGAVLSVAAAGRWLVRLTRYEMLALAFGSFLIFSPGFRLEHAVYVVPVLFACNVPRATLYTWLAGAFLGLAYVTYGTADRFWSSHLILPLSTPATFVGLVAWGELVATCVGILTNARHRSPESPRRLASSKALMQLGRY